jgi:hypothetical protein
MIGLARPLFNLIRTLNSFHQRSANGNKWAHRAEA